MVDRSALSSRSLGKSLGTLVVIAGALYAALLLIPVGPGGWLVLIVLIVGFLLSSRRTDEPVPRKNCARCGARNDEDAPTCAHCGDAFSIQADA